MIERDYRIRFRDGILIQIATSPIDAVRRHFGASSEKIYRLGTTTHGWTLVQIIWPDGTGDQVEVRRYEGWI